MIRSYIPTALVAFIYCIIVFLVPKSGFWINDNGCKLLQTRSLNAKGPADASIDWPGASIDPDFRFVPIRPPFGYVHEAKLFIQYSPIFALLSVLPYRAFGMAGLYILPLIGGILTVEAVRRLSVLLVCGNSASSAGDTTDESLAKYAALFGALVAGLATPVMFYSSVFWEHTISIAFVSWAAVLMVKRFLGAGKGPLIGSAAALALSIYFRDDMYLLAAVWAAMLFFSRYTHRDSILFVITGLIVCIPLWTYHYFVLGNPLGFHFSGTGPFHAGFSIYLTDRWLVFRNLFLSSHSHSQASIMASLPFLFCLLVAAKKRLALNLQVTMLMSVIACVAGLGILLDHLTSPLPLRHLLSSFSFFAASPILMIASFGPSNESLHTSLHTFAIRWIIRLLLWYFLLYALVAPPENATAIQWGCRFLLPGYPLLAALAGVTLARLFSEKNGVPLIRWLAGSLLAISIALQAYSISLLYRRQNTCAELNRIVSQQKADVIVTDAWFLGQELAPIFFDRPIFQFTQHSQWPELESMLVDHGVQSVLLIQDLRSGVSPPQLAIFDDGMGLIRVGMQVQSIAPSAGHQ